MNELRQDDATLTWRGPHCSFGPETPPGFTPLRMVLISGKLAVEVTKPEVVIGRHTDVDIRLAMPEISRRHCRVLFDDGDWRIQDLDSTNGVYVNEERVQEATLAEGDQVRISGLVFTVELGGPTRLSITAEEEGDPQVQFLKSIVQFLPRRRAS